MHRLTKLHWSHYCEVFLMGDHAIILSLVTGKLICLNFRGDTLDDLFAEVCEKAELLELLRAELILTEHDLSAQRWLVTRLNEHFHELAHKTPYLCLIPTLECNLDCAYCYEKMAASTKDKRRLTMSPLEIQQFLAILEQEDTACFTLFGGEPLLGKNLPLLLPLLRHVSERNGSIRAISNGTEIHEYLEFLGPTCISDIQVTIDGMQDVHDRFRSYADGSGTWNSILRNIRACVERGVHVHIRLNARSDNYDSCEAFMQFFQHTENQEGITFDLSAIYGPCGDIDYGSIHASNYCQVTHPILRRFKALRRDGTPLYMVPSFCATTSRGGMAMIGPGAIWNCWHLVGNFSKSLGTIEELIINPNIVRHEQPPQFAEPCLSCRYLLLCQGECPARPYTSKATCSRDLIRQLLETEIVTGGLYQETRSKRDWSTENVCRGSLPKEISYL